MADLAIRTTGVTPDADYRWLRSKLGRDNAVSGTIDVSKLVAGTHYDQRTGVVPCGLPLGRVTATGKLAPYKADATDGTEILAGFLMEPEPLLTDLGGLIEDAHVAVLVVGVIDVAHVPTSPTLNNKTLTLGQFVFHGATYVK